MNEIFFLDNDFQDIQDSNINLSILIYKGGFSFSWHEKTNNKYIGIANFFGNNKNLREKIYELDLQNKKYNQVDVTFASFETCLIPDSFFDNSTFKDFINFNFNIDEKTDEIKFVKLDKFKMYSVFSVKKDSLEVVNQFFDKVNLYPHNYVFIKENLLRTVVSEDEIIDKVYVQVFPQFIDIMLIKAKELSFYNTFKYISNNDIIYHILNLFEQLKLNQEETEVVFSGFIEKNDMSIINLRKFIKLIGFESVNPKYNYHYKIQDIQPHYFYNFLNVIKCE